MDIVKPPNPSSISKLPLPESLVEMTDLIKACMDGRLDDVKGILNNSATQSNSTPSDRNKLCPVLLTAIDSNKWEIVGFLLEAGVPLNESHVSKALDTKSTDMFAVLVQHGWEINRQRGNFRPPALACVVQEPELATWFLDYGADPNARCLIDLTPLSYAVRYASLEVIELMFDRGGDASRGQLAHWAVERETSELRVLHLLAENGAPLHDIQYYHDPVSWNLFSYQGLGTPLHAAAALGKDELVSYLLSTGADPMVKDTKGRTVLDRAESCKEGSIIGPLGKA